MPGAVTQYVRNEMRNLNALSGDDKRRKNVGFVLQTLQRRLASSPAAIYQSLRRRRERLEFAARGGARRREERRATRARCIRPVLEDDEDRDLDEIAHHFHRAARHPSLSRADKIRRRLGNVHGRI